MVQTAESGSGESPLRVLVVDDDSSIRRMIVAALRREGYVFSEAANGREALDIMRQDPPSIVVLDLMMPVVSGWDVLRERGGDQKLLSIPFDIAALAALVRSCVAA